MSQKTPIRIERACEESLNSIDHQIRKAFRSLHSPAKNSTAALLPLEPRVLLTTIALTPGLDDTVDIKLSGSTVQFFIDNTSTTPNQTVNVADFTSLTIDPGFGDESGSDSVRIDLPGRSIAVNTTAPDVDPLDIEMIEGTMTVQQAASVNGVQIDPGAQLVVVAGGDLATTSIQIAGSYAQSGGHVTATASFNAGTGVGQQATVNVSAGTLSAGAAFFGYGGQTTVTQTGGELSFSTTQIGSYSSQTSSVQQTGGTFSSSDFWMGYFGHASYYLGTGATLACAGEHMGSAGAAIFTNAGGSNDGLAGNAGWELGAHNGHAVYTQTAGSTTGGGVMGWWDGDSTVNLSGGSFTCNGFNALGGWSDGNSGQGTFNQTGGSCHIFQLALGYTGGTGTYNLSGGNLWTGFVNIGLSQGVAAGHGTFNQTGGHHTINWGGNGGGGATEPEVYNLDGGALHGLLDPNSALTIHFTSGTWTAGLIDDLTPVSSQSAEPGTAVTVTASFTNTDGNPNYATSVIDWGDGTVQPLTVTPISGGGRVAPSHIYAQPGLYHALINVIDPFRYWEGGFAEAAFDVKIISRVTAVSYEDETAQRLHVTFAEHNSDVNSSWLQLRNLTTNTLQPAASQTFTWDSPTSRSGTFSFSGLLPDGNYIAAVGDSAYLSTTPKGFDEADFFVWSGDVNHDRSVNSLDQQIVQTNQNLTPATFSQGDLNYDGTVDFADLAIMGNKYQTTLALPPTPGTITASPTGPTAIALTWTKVPGVAGYRIQYSTDGSNFLVLKDLPGDSAIATTVTGLQDGTRYWYRVRGYGNDRDTGYTAKVAATTVIAAPTDLSVLPYDDGTFDIAWTDNSQSEDGYEIDATANGNVVSIDLKSDTNSCSLTRLNSGTDYSFSVKAMRAGIQSASAIQQHSVPDLSSSAETDLVASESMTYYHGTPTYFLNMSWTLHNSQISQQGIELSRNGGPFVESWSLTGRGTSLGTPSYFTLGSGPQTTSSDQFRVRLRGYSSQGSYAYSRPVTVSFEQSRSVSSTLRSLAPIAHKLTSGWLQYGDQASVIDANTVQLGLQDGAKTDQQAPAVRGYSIPIPANGPNELNLAYELHTWDTFSLAAGTAGGFWDMFAATVSDLPYLQSPSYGSQSYQTSASILTSKINYSLLSTNESQFVWGGSQSDNESSAQSTTSTVQLRVPQDGKLHYLNLILDTSFPNAAKDYRNVGDGCYPSWGTFKFWGANLQVDSNNDGTINAADTLPAPSSQPDVVLASNKTDSGAAPANLVKAQVSLWPAGTTSLSGTGTLEFSDSGLKAYQDAAGRTPLSATSWQLSQLPETLYLGTTTTGGYAKPHANFEVDASGEPTLDSRPLTAGVFLVDLKATETRLPNNTVTDFHADPIDSVLYIANQAAGAGLTLEPSVFDFLIFPQQASVGKVVLWKVTDTDNGFQANGNFAGGQVSITLPNSDHVQTYTVVAGIDSNQDGTLEQNEVKPAITIYTVLRTKLSVQVQAFIKEDHVTDPIDPSYIFDGNNRETANGSPIADRNGTGKVTLGAEVQPYQFQTPSELAAVSKTTSGTRKYARGTSLDSTGHISATAQADTVLNDGNMKVDYGNADLSHCTITLTRLGKAKVQVRFIIVAHDPLIDSEISADIDAQFDLVLDYTDPKNPTCQLVGSHEFFPCFQVYVNSQNLDIFDSGTNGPDALVGGGMPVSVVKTVRIDGDDNN